MFTLTKGLLHEDESRNDSLYDYVVNTDRFYTSDSSGTLRLYTDEGWSYLQIYQDTVYHNYRVSSNSITTSYSYTVLNEPITNLFSRTVYIQVTDKKTEISFVKADYTTIEVDKSTGYLTYAEPLSDAVFTAYPVDENGVQIGSEVYTAVSDSDGVVTFYGLPLGRTYRIDETEAPTGYSGSSWHWLVTISESGMVTKFLSADNSSTVTQELEYYTVDTQQPDNYSMTDQGNYITYYWPNMIAVSLPETGGSGTQTYTFTGLFLCSLAALLYIKRKIVVLRTE